MRDGDLLDSFKWFCSGSNVVHGVKDVGAVIARAACVADTDDYIFKHDESFLMLKGLALDLLRTDGSVTIFAPITIDGVVVGLRWLHRS